MLAMKDVFMTEPTTALVTCGSGHKKRREECRQSLSMVFMLAMQGGFMSESATVGLELLELRVRKGVIRRGRAQGSSCKQKGRQRQRSELEGHNAVVKTSNEGGCYEDAMSTR